MIDWQYNCLVFSRILYSHSLYQHAYTYTQRSLCGMIQPVTVMLDPFILKYLERYKPSYGVHAVLTIFLIDFHRPERLCLVPSVLLYLPLSLAVRPLLLPTSFLSLLLLVVFLCSSISLASVAYCPFSFQSITFSRP